MPEPTRVAFFEAASDCLPAVYRGAMSVVSGVKARALGLVAEAYRRLFAAGRIPRGTTYGAPGRDHVQVVMCLWNRPDRLDDVLRMLRDQSGGHAIDLSLWNNNRRERGLYDSLVAEAELGGALASVRLVHSPFNLGSIGRFYFAREWNRQKIDRAVVVIDDDQDIPDTFVDAALSSFDPHAVTAFWAFTVHGEYHEREHAAPGDVIQHIGPGGSVSSSRVYVKEFFTQLPLRYWFLDDLWLSHWAIENDLELRKLDVAIVFADDDRNQYPALVPLKIEAFRHFATLRDDRN